MGHDSSFVLPYLMALIAADVVARMAERLMVLEGIEQATYDREFWELVADAG